MPPDSAASDVLSAPPRGPIGRLKRRGDFLHVGKGRRWHGAAMTIQAAVVPGGEASRVGFTLTKRVGNAVVRNRARRRLREAVRLVAGDLRVENGHDYVIVGRVDAIRLPFAALLDELLRGVAAVHRSGKTRGDAARGRRHPAPKDAIPAERAAPERIRPRP